MGEHAAALARRTDMQVGVRGRSSSISARRLLPDVVLPFDDPALAGCTVGDVLADPEGFEGGTLADPLEGVAYGPARRGSCVAPTERCGSIRSPMAAPSTN